MVITLCTGFLETPVACYACMVEVLCEVCPATTGQAVTQAPALCTPSRSLQTLVDLFM